ncbi:hypothetical protein ACSSS7_007831 [Eimeria intestinalis]
MPRQTLTGQGQHQQQQQQQQQSCWHHRFHLKTPCLLSALCIEFDASAVSVHSPQWESMEGWGPRPRGRLRNGRANGSAAKLLSRAARTPQSSSSSSSSSSVSTRVIEAFLGKHMQDKQQTSSSSSRDGSRTCGIRCKTQTAAEKVCCCAETPRATPR